MNLEEILAEIKAGLTGNHERDIPYLKTQEENYIDSEFADEIFSTCTKWMCENTSDEEIESIIRDGQENMESVIQEIQRNLEENNVHDAYEMSEFLVHSTEGFLRINEEYVSKFYTFDDVFEEILFVNYAHPEKEIACANYPYSQMYAIHGTILLRMDRVEEARKYLRKALRWNPASCSIAFVYIDTWKVNQELDMFYELTKKLLCFTYKKSDIAHCFRNLGYYYSEKEEYALAFTCYMISLYYEPENNLACTQLNSITDIAFKEVEKPSLEEMKSYIDQYNLPTGANPVVIELANRCAQEALEKENLEMAIHFYEILYQLTNDLSIKDKLETLKKD